MKNIMASNKVNNYKKNVTIEKFGYYKKRQPLQRNLAAIEKDNGYREIH